MSRRFRAALEERFAFKRQLPVLFSWFGTVEIKTIGVIRSTSHSGSSCDLCYHTSRVSPVVVVRTQNASIKCDVPCLLKTPYQQTHADAPRNLCTFFFFATLRSPRPLTPRTHTENEEPGKIAPGNVGSWIVDYDDNGLPFW